MSIYPAKRAGPFSFYAYRLTSDSDPSIWPGPGAPFSVRYNHLALTICSAYSTRRQLGAQADMPLHTLIIRDGAIYFAAIGLANLANIITFIIDGPLLPGSLTMFTTCISVAMVSRVMMNIYKKTDVDAAEFNLSILREGASIHIPDSGSPEAEAAHHPDPY
ncbi:hypothetical protein B0H13DRAFT_2345232 [Mycena leptocephala]|nr:hypothetical protein B0H13DRAFT_2345232 [Mycena leptocephala]